jgi:hypothetical protein
MWKLSEYELDSYKEKINNKTKTDLYDKIWDQQG